MSGRFDCFLDKIQLWTEKKLTDRKVKKEYKKTHRTLWTEIYDWADAIVFAVVVVLLINQFIFQLFVIPSPSMLETFQLGDRVYVSKTKYGTELFPYGPKIFNKAKQPDRDEVITFYNPEIESQGTFKDILTKMVYMGTFSLVNLDRDENGNIRESLLIKRAAGVAGDIITFRNGQAYIMASGTYKYVNEADFRKANGYAENPHRTIKDETYKGYNAQGILEGLHSSGISTNNFPKHLVQDYQKLDKNAFYTDYYEYEKRIYQGQRLADPTDMEARSNWAKMVNGIYIPQGKVLPLGDNRDNSADGRYFGPVSIDDINGYVRWRIWPFSRIGSPYK